MWQRSPQTGKSYVLFRVADVSRLMGKVDIYVGATKCAVEVRPNKKQRLNMPLKRGFPASSDEEEGLAAANKRLKTSLDAVSGEHENMKKELLELRTTPQIAILQAKCADLEKGLEVSKLQYDDKIKALKQAVEEKEQALEEKEREARMMRTVVRTLLEQQGLLRPGEDLYILAQAIAMSVERDA